MKAISFVMFCSVVLTSFAASADDAAADACAANLQSDGKAIYAASIPGQPTAANLKSIVESQTRSLAMAGKISRESARTNAIAAAECIRMRF